MPEPAGPSPADNIPQDRGSRPVTTCSYRTSVRGERHRWYYPVPPVEDAVVASSRQNAYEGGVSLSARVHAISRNAQLQGGARIGVLDCISLRDRAGDRQQ